MKSHIASKPFILNAILLLAILAVVAGCRTADDAFSDITLPAATAKSTAGLFDSEKLAGVSADYREDSAIFTCTEAACGGDAVVLFQMVTLTEEQKNLLQADRLKGYAAISEEAATYFVLPADPSEGKVSRGFPSYTEQKGIMARQQTMTVPKPSDPAKKVARLVVLADREQSHVFVAYAGNGADATKAAQKILSAWGAGIAPAPG